MSKIAEARKITRVKITTFTVFVFIKFDFNEKTLFCDNMIHTSNIIENIFVLSF